MQSFRGKGGIRMTLSDRIKKHQTIENRILLPFLFISVTAVAVLFAGLYHFGGGRGDKVTSVFYEQRYVVLGGIALLMVSALMYILRMRRRAVMAPRRQ